MEMRIKPRRWFMQNLLLDSEGNFRNDKGKLILAMEHSKYCGHIVTLIEVYKDRRLVITRDQRTFKISEDCLENIEQYRIKPIEWFRSRYHPDCGGNYRDLSHEDRVVLSEPESRYAGQRIDLPEGFTGFDLVPVRTADGKNFNLYAADLEICDGESESVESDKLCRIKPIEWFNSKYKIDMRGEYRDPSDNYRCVLFPNESKYTGQQVKIVGIVDDDIVGVRASDGYEFNMYKADLEFDDGDEVDTHRIPPYPGGIPFHIIEENAPVKLSKKDSIFFVKICQYPEKKKTRKIDIDQIVKDSEINDIYLNTKK